MKYYFTKVENDELGQVIESESDQPPETGTYIPGAWANDMFKLVNGEVVNLDQADFDEINARLKQVKPKPTAIVSKFAKLVSEAGLSTINTLPPTQDWTKADAHNAIDQAAGRARFRVMSPGTLLSEEYKLTQAQVNAWRSAGSLANAVPATLQSWVTATGMTAEEAAQDIEQTAAQYEGLLELIRDTRLIGKANVNNEQTDYISIALAVIAQLDGL